MFRAFTQMGSYRWTDFIDSLVDSYNNSKHRSINMSPNDVTLANESIVRNNLYPKPTKAVRKVKPKFKKGDLVRISRKDNIFRKGYKETYTYEVFKVDKIKNTVPITYGLVSFNGENIAGSFYPAEMQKVDKSNNVYPIENVIKKRLRDGVLEYRVSYKGFDSSYNEWVKASDIFPVNQNVEI